MHCVEHEELNGIEWKLYMSEIVLDKNSRDLGVEAMNQVLREHDETFYEGEPESIWEYFADKASNAARNGWNSLTQAEKVSAVSGGIATLAQFGISRVPLLSSVVLPAVITYYMASSTNVIDQVQNRRSSSPEYAAEN